MGVAKSLTAEFMLIVVLINVLCRYPDSRLAVALQLFSTGTFPLGVGHGSSVFKHMLLGLLNKECRHERDVGFSVGC